MLWCFITAGGAGFLFGLWLRVPVVLAASAFIVTTGVSMTPGEALPEAIMLVFMMLTTLQFSYLVGLMLSGAGTGVTSQDPSRTSSGR
jgi:hypothetical protein